MNRKEILGSLVDAITVSGKKFSEISKKSIFDFLKREGISEKYWNEIYEDLHEVYQGQKIKKQSNKQYTTDVDYSDNSHNEVKYREPRKSIFSEIKKIAG